MKNKIPVPLKHKDINYTFKVLRIHPRKPGTRYIYKLSPSAINIVLNNLDGGPDIANYKDLHENEQKELIAKFESNHERLPPFMPCLKVRDKNARDRLVNKDYKPNYLVRFSEGHQAFSFLIHMQAEFIPIYITEESANYMNEMCGRVVCFLYDATPI